MPASQNSPLQAWARALGNIAELNRSSETTLAHTIDHVAERFGDRPALASPAEVLTYRGLSERKNQYARWASQHNIAHGQVVGLLMGNCPDYVALWLGLTQAGVTVALINTNLTGEALAQALQAAAATHVIVDGAFLAAVEAVRQQLAAEITCWCPAIVEHHAGVRPLDVSALGRFALALECRDVHAHETALLIYTSGTTGLPKAARISHYRILEWSFWFAGMIGTGPDDRLYNCLPMYHSTGGVVGIGAMLVSGGCVEIRTRFSARRFWADVVEADCTLFIYIGELCRYLLAAPACEAETRHRLRLCFGNGLRGDIWQNFVDRFHVPHMLEFYASTEGNVSLYNCEARPGAIGRVPAFMAHRFPVALIECDQETGEALRDADGRCVKCAPGRVGEAIGKISEQAAGPTAFEGYTDAAATERKILRGVFAPDDAWFRTGDLMRQDKERFFYFVDRMGDTFRWKGENVSSAQVAEALCGCEGVSGALVYGVSIDGTEGRAGMAAITVSQAFSPGRLHADIAARLPPYARPVFVRVCAVLETTGTFKPVKASLVREGYDLSLVKDPVYINDAEAGTYRPLGADEARRLHGECEASPAPLEITGAA